MCGHTAGRQLVWKSWEAWELKVLRDGLKRWFVGAEEGKVPVDRPQRMNRRSQGQQTSKDPPPTRTQFPELRECPQTVPLAGGGQLSRQEPKEDTPDSN